MRKDITRVAAVIVSWERLGLLKRCLASIDSQVLPDWLRIETVVIDDGSSDGTAAFLGEYAAGRADARAWRFASNQGPGVARNAALRLTDAEFLFFLDTDARLQSPDALARFAGRLREDTRTAIVGGTIWSDEAHEQPPFIIGGYVTPLLHADLPRWRTEHEAPHFLTTCCSMWRREAIEELGGFDPFYGHGVEDGALALRIASRGWGLKVLPEVDAVHDLSDEGRRRPHRDFEKVFRYLESKRTYLYLQLHGFRSAARATIRALGAREAFEEAYGRPLSRRQLLLAQWAYPLRSLAAYPWRRLANGKRSFVENAPSPEEIIGKDRKDVNVHRNDTR